MSKFVSGADLEKVIYDVIWEAESILLVVSPFIKLDNYFKRLFDNHIHNPNVHILVVFGKNEGQVNRSLSKIDFDYFKKFMNVTIVYEPSLHGKYYANEKKGVLTSINLYDYSFKNNVEFGIFSERNLLNNFRNSSDDDAFEHCRKIADNGEVVFVKRPLFDKKPLSTIFGKSYVSSEILHDVTNKFYGGASSFNKSKEGKKRLSEFPTELEIGTTRAERPTKEQPDKKPTGYCIRTGQSIPYNLQRPLSYDAYKTWVFFENYDFPEAYCHKTGKPSYGKTTMRKPIL